jgi:hypothetical protein
VTSGHRRVIKENVNFVMQSVYCFSSENQTNLWAGYGAKVWAVSDCKPTQMEVRKTKSLDFPIGALGLLYCSAAPKFFTMPFKVASEVEWRMETKIWPEPWAMPFRIEPLGSPRYRLTLSDAYKELECLNGKQSITDVFFIGGTMNFTASHIPDEDWAIVLEELAIH